MRFDVIKEPLVLLYADKKSHKGLSGGYKRSRTLHNAPKRSIIALDGVKGSYRWL